MDVLYFNLDEIERWLLMFFRVSSMMMVFPVYGFASVPMRIRVGLAFLIASLLFPVHIGVELELGAGILYFIGAVLKEVAIGLAIGLVAQFLFEGVRMTGHVIGRMIGFGIINAVDPNSGVSVPILSQIFYLFVMILFILMDGHHFLLLALDESFVRIPIGAGVFSSLAVEGFARMSADIFIIGVKFGAPVLITILVVEFALGIVARTVPQINVWLIGFPLKIGIGLITIALSLPYFAYLFGKMYADWQGHFIDFIMTMIG